MTDDQLITDVVSEKVKNDSAFTAWTVYCEAKKKGIAISYKDAKGKIKAAVKPFLDQGVYVQTYDVNVGTGKAILFHPPGFDVTAFKADDPI